MITVTLQPDTESRTLSGEAGARMVASFAGQGYELWFLVAMPGAVQGGIAVALLGAVAAQVPWPSRAPQIQATLGAAAGLMALALPWATAYLPVDGGLEVRRYWLWSIGSSAIWLGIAMLAVLALSALGWLVLRRMPLPLMLGIVVLGLVTIFVPSMLEAGVAVERQLAASDPMSVPESGAPRVMELAGLLLCFAAIRSWWRGRRGRGAGAVAGPAPGPAPAVAGSPAWPTTAP